ncbi:MAG: tetratricopeptide repeat protein [Bacteroidia bacterium]|nr:tetratricopeptide repeat protein [Bacteroidia bacterium]
MFYPINMKPVKQRPIKNGQKKEVAKSGKQGYAWMLAVCLALTLITYMPVFHSGFVNWDDDDYATKNLTIRSLSNMGNILTTPVQGNYHPLTMLSLAVNYAMSGRSASSYHILNLLLHLINVVLVFFLFRKLSNGRNWTGFITALLFGIHPLHVESVAWVSERKDVLYALFFLSAMLVYLRYLERGKWPDLILVFILFVLSILSKPAAIIFPVALLTIDYYYMRLDKWKTYLEKIPFLLVAVFFSVLTLKAQSHQGAVAEAGMFSATSRFFFGNYGIMIYLVKAIVPFNLCAFYPFPPINMSLPADYYLSPIVSLALIALLVIYRRKNRVLTFSILFYLVNLLLVLQFLPVGSAVIADRYTYLPLLGPFFLIGYYVQQWIEKNKSAVPGLLYAILTLASVVFVTTGYSQATTWKNGTALWDKAISAAPGSRAYCNRANLYKAEKKYDKAMKMYDEAIRLNKQETEALINRGNIYFDRKQYQLAIDDYNKCFAIDPDKQKTYENRGAAYAETGKYDLAMSDFNRAIELDPKTENGYLSRGLLFDKLNRENEAIGDFRRQMSIVPDSSGDMWNTIGCAYLKMKDFNAALDAFNHAIQIFNNGVFYFNRAITYYQLKQFDQACRDALKSKSLGYNVSPEFMKVAGCN